MHRLVDSGPVKFELIGDIEDYSTLCREIIVQFKGVQLKQNEIPKPTVMKKIKEIINTIRKTSETLDVHHHITMQDKTLSDLIFELLLKQGYIDETSEKSRKKQFSLRTFVATPSLEELSNLLVVYSTSPSSP